MTQKFIKQKKEALNAVGEKEQWSDAKSYYAAKKSITKEFYAK